MYRLMLSASAFLALHGTAFAGHHHHIRAPEIDGPAGIAAVAVLAALALRAYENRKQ